MYHRQISDFLTLTAKRGVADKYYEENIDKTGKGYVNINEWIDVLTEIDGFNEFNVWEKKRIFYYTMYLSTRVAKMYKQDFYLFVNTYTLGSGYHQVYGHFMNALCDKVPDLIKDDFLGWIQ